MLRATFLLHAFLALQQAHAGRPSGVGNKPPADPPGESWVAISPCGDSFSHWTASEGFGYAHQPITITTAGWGNNEFQYYHPRPIEVGLVKTHPSCDGCCGAKVTIKVVTNRTIMEDGMKSTLGSHWPNALSEEPLCDQYCRQSVKSIVFDSLFEDCRLRCQVGRSIVSAKLVSNFAIKPDSSECSKYRVSFDFIPGPDGTCQWPAIWMLPESNDAHSSGSGPYGPWPSSGELDIFETQNNYRRKFMTMHYMSASGNHIAAGGTSRYGGGPAHFQFEWTTTYVAWFQRFDQWAAGNETGSIPFPAPFDQPFNIIVNFAMGGGLTGVDDYQKCIDCQWWRR